MTKHVHCIREYWIDLNNFDPCMTVSAELLSRSSILHPSSSSLFWKGSYPSYLQTIFCLLNLVHVSNRYYFNELYVKNFKPLLIFFYLSGPDRSTAWDFRNFDNLNFNDFLKFALVPDPMWTKNFTMILLLRITTNFSNFNYFVLWQTNFI